MRIMTRAQAGWLVRILAIIGSLIILALLAGVASATTLTVTNTDDSGVGSLRQAILDASPGDTIDFNIPGGGPHTITLDSGQLTIDKDLTIQGPGAEVLSISGNSEFRVIEITNGAEVTISGLTVTEGSRAQLAGLAGTGAGILVSDGSVTISSSVITGNTASFGGGVGNAAGSILEVVDSTISGNTSTASTGAGGIQNLGTLTISNSSVVDNVTSGRGGGVQNASTGATLDVISSTISGNASTGQGGGIRNVGTLIVVDSEISNNAGSSGGAVWTGGGTATITDSMIVGNTATFTGGGIWVEVGALTVSNSVISGNTVDTGGGGILVAAGATVTITDSTISGNSAGVWGGGLQVSQGVVTVSRSTISHNFAPAGGGVNNQGATTLTISNSTISGNHSDGPGGAIQNKKDTANLVIQNSTIAFNSTTSGADHAAFVNLDDATVEVTASIIANNDGGPNCSGDFPSGAFNLSDDDTCPADQNVTNINLGPLADNGGPTQTHALMAGSAAIDVIPQENCDLATDQRGVDRPQPAGGACDIGAFELDDFSAPVNNPPVITAPADQSADEGTGTDFDLGSFADPDDSDSWTVTVNWGDGSSEETFAVNAPGSLGTRTHTYDDNDTYTVTVTVTDEEDESDSATFQVVVVNVAPTANFSAPATVDEGSPILLELTDPFDPSMADTVAGFDYAFDCGDGAGYSAFGPSSSASCSTVDNETRTVGGKIRDKDGGESEYTATVEVLNVPPSVSAPADQSADEGEPVSYDLGSFSDPGPDSPWQVMVDWGDGSPSLTFDVLETGSLGTSDHTYADDGSYTVTVSVTDKDGDTGDASFQVTVHNVAPTVGEITAPLDPVAVNTTVEISAGFTDPGVLDIHTALIDWGDGESSLGTVMFEDGVGTVSGEHSYTAAGIYTVTLTVTDNADDEGQATFQYIVVYDPSAGFVTGGGWIDSPAGAYMADPSLTGRANFGFVSRYQRGANVPTGNTQFRFRAGDLNFHSTSYEWLVITGNDVARFKGQGTINGALASNGQAYQFMIWAGDGSPDTFRIKIWWVDNGTEIVVYDNKMHQPIGGGSIVIHSK